MISSFTESSRPGYNFRSVWHSDLARLYAHWKSGMDVGVGCQAVLVLACSCHWWQAGAGGPLTAPMLTDSAGLCWDRLPALPMGAPCCACVCEWVSGRRRAAVASWIDDCAPLIGFIGSGASARKHWTRCPQCPPPPPTALGVLCGPARPAVYRSWRPSGWRTGWHAASDLDWAVLWPARRCDHSRRWLNSAAPSSRTLSALMSQTSQTPVASRSAVSSRILPSAVHYPDHSSLPSCYGVWQAYVFHTTVAFVVD